MGPRQFYSTAKRKARRVVERLADHVIGTTTSVSTEEKVVALTFDDGPSPDSTPRLLEILHHHGAKATFFMVGMAAARWPQLVRDVADQGHAIGNHSWDHGSFPLLSGRQRRHQLRACARALAPYEQRLFRPPYGNQNTASYLDAALLGYRVIAWNGVCGDWTGDGAKLITERLSEHVRPGAIILLHDALFSYVDDACVDRSATFAAVDAVLERFKREYRFVTVPQLLRLGRPQTKRWHKLPDRKWLGTVKRSGLADEGSAIP